MSLEKRSDFQRGSHFHAPTSQCISDEEMKEGVQKDIPIQCQQIHMAAVAPIHSVFLGGQL